MFEKNIKYVYYAAFLLFILSGVYGLLLRWNFAYPISGFSYNNMLQSHSHVAFLGWGFLASIGAIFQLFVKGTVLSKKPVYLWSVLIMAVSVFLMLISFPLGGYKVFSIVLLAVFGLVSYIFFFHLLRDLKGNNMAVKLVRWAIYYYILSSLATWFLAGVLVTQGRTDLYYNTVYFYLHFLYNGYFVFVLFGILLRVFNINSIEINNRFIKPFFIYLNVSCVPTYALSVLWSGPGKGLYIIGFAGALMQIIALVYLIFVFKNKGRLRPLGNWMIFLINFVLISFALKVLLQFLSAFPYFVEKSLMLKPYFVIGYLHLFTLCFMTVFIVLILKQLGAINITNRITRLGLVLLILGIVLTESLLFGQGFLLMTGYGMIPDYNSWLLLCSLILALGICSILLPQFRKNAINPESFCQ
jgi:hypothetical protein